MNRLRNVKLTAEQLQWLIKVDYTVNYYPWQSHKSTPNLIYTENKELRIQVTRDVNTQEITIWTWEI